MPILHFERWARGAQFRQLGLPALLALLLLVGGIGWLASRRQRMVPPARPIPTIAGNIESRLNNVIIRNVAGGKITWVVKASQVDTAKDRPITRFTGLQHIAVMNGNQRELTVNADTLELNTLSNDLSLIGRVSLTGKSLLFRAPQVRWNAAQETLTIPQKLSAQLGDFTVKNEGTTLYDVKAATLRCQGRLVLATQGNILQATGATIDIARQRIELDGPGVADLEIADMEQWASGGSLPQIPPIPDSIKAKYQRYLQQQTARPAPTPTPARRPFLPWKGHRP